MLPIDYIRQILTISRYHLKYKVAKKKKIKVRQRTGNCADTYTMCMGMALWLDNVSLQYKLIDPVGEVM